MSKGSFFTRLCALSLASLAVLPAVAAEGRIPVFLPGTVLCADGKYIVTRNLIGPGPVVLIAAQNVDLDLNGFLVFETTSANPAIRVAAAACSPGPPDHVTIHNGTITGSSTGIEVPNGVSKIDIEDVKIHNVSGPGIHLTDALGAAIRRTEIVDASGVGIWWDGGIAFKHGTIQDNLTRRTSDGIIVTNQCSSIGIVNNRIEEPAAGGGFGGYGIVLSGCGSSLVSENTVERAIQDGIGLFQCKGNKLYDNVVTAGSGNGIHLDRGTSDTLVLNNVSTGNGTAGGPGGNGLNVEGIRNMIQGNILNSNVGVGLLFNGFGVAGAACENTFGRNTARGNTGAGLPPCGGAPPLFPPNSCNATVNCAVPNSTFGDNLIPGPPIF